MKRILIALALPMFAMAQNPVPAPPSLPTIGLLGASFNQTATPRWNLLASAIYQQPGLNNNWYASTSIDAVPVQRIVNNRKIYSFSFSIRQGLNYVVYRTDASEFPRASAFVGFDAGVALQQASPSGTNVNFAGATSGGLVGRIGAPTSSFGWFAVVRLLYLPGDPQTMITPVGEVGVAYHFKH